MAEAIVGGPLLAVGKHLVGLVHLLETHLGRLVAGIAVGMELHRALPERGLEFDLGAGLRDAQRLVIIALGHQRTLFSASRLVT